MADQQRQLRRYRLALVAVVLALVGVALVGATGDKDAVFDTVTAREIRVENEKGQSAVSLGAIANGGYVVPDRKLHFLFWFSVIFNRVIKCRS